MTKIIDVQANELIMKAAAELKNMKEIQAPEWAPFVKTGNNKERPPVDNDWWYVRAAAILRTVYLRGPVGVSKLRTKFGGNQDRGHKPSRFTKASGNIIRKCLQQLEAAKLIKHDKVGNHSGRVLTKEGKAFLDSLVGEAKPAKKEAKPKAAKAEEKPEVKEEKAPKAEEKAEAKTEAEE